MDKQTEITKYNNQIAEKEADYDLKYQELAKKLQDAEWEKETDLINLTGKYGANMIEKYKQSQIYSMVDNYLASLSCVQAKEILENNETLKGYLTSQNLTSLLKKYS